MISKIKNAAEAFVWVWLPNQSNPIICGKLITEQDRYTFIYGKKYLALPNAIPLSPFELPLTDTAVEPTGIRKMPSCIRDALPDAWGRRLIEEQYAHIQPNELDYGLLSGTDRIGAFDFQASAHDYEKRDGTDIGLEAVEDLAKALEKGQHFTKKLAPVLLHGTSVGGARPKCLITINKTPYIAKFSLSTDPYPFIKSEFLGMKLAKLVNIHVADVELKSVLGRDVLLIKRFDRALQKNKMYRRIMLSGLSLLGLDELEARYASYADLGDIIRVHFDEPKSQLKELFKRLVFNILVGNTDDHAKNHSAFWDGHSLMLTPAYDICPQIHIGFEATQAMMIEGDDDNKSTLQNVFSTHEKFLLTKSEAKNIITDQLKKIDRYFITLCDQAKLNSRERKRLWGHVIKSEYCLQGWNEL